MNSEEPPSSSLENSVLLHHGRVWILDRRTFPFERTWRKYVSAEGVAAAIRDMVTQSAGPIFATGAALEMTAAQCSELSLDEARARLLAAGRILSLARPTNDGPAVIAGIALESAREATTVEALVSGVISGARAARDGFLAASRAIGETAAALLHDGQRVLTHCWMDTFLTELVRAGIRSGKRFSWIATETRPYLQGARLTAHTLRELGQDVTLVTDGMGAAVLKGGTLGQVDALVTAADRVSLDGSVANKVGTLALAVAAGAFGVPYYALVRRPDASIERGADIPIEERDASHVLYALGNRTASELVQHAWYPAFDVTPPQFVTRVVTAFGAFAPDELRQRFQGDPR